MKRITISILTSFIFFCCYSQSYPVIREIKHPPLFDEQLHYISSLLQQPGAEVRILVYGQSISEQDWWKDVKVYFENKYPKSKIHFINKAIGGFSADRLKLTAANDVVTFYPDLILFHDYGSEADYETIIRIIKSKTTADIAVQTDHMTKQNNEWHDRHSNSWLPQLCKKYGLALLDIRKYWKQYLAENNLAASDLLSDNVHLNKHGNYLMAGIIKNHFDNLTFHASLDGRRTILEKGKHFSSKKDRIQVSVSGNRIDVAGDNSAAGSVIHISRNGPDTNKGGCFYHTRPSLKPDGSFLTNIGLLLQMEFTNNTKEEDWSLTITSVDSVQQQLSFTIKGSVTGEDGSGNSSRLFTSNSGSIIIKPVSWFRRRDKGDFAQFTWLKAGDVLQWKVRSMCHDRLTLAPLKPQTLFQGIHNGAHQLIITGPGAKHIDKIIVYKPLPDEN